MREVTRHMDNTGRPLNDAELLKKCGTTEPITTTDLGVPPIENGGLQTITEGVNVLHYDYNKSEKENQ